MLFMKHIFFLFCVALMLNACKKDPNGVMNTGTFTVAQDPGGPLKSVATGFPIGFAIGYTPFKNDTKYAATVAAEGTSVTFDYYMKHGAVVRDNGTFDFTRTDELVNLASAAGLQIFGHTLGWHANQNAVYLKNYAGITVPAAAELAINGGFENGGASLANWSTYNAQNGATVGVGSGGTEVRTGTRSMKVVNPVANPGNQWRSYEYRSRQAIRIYLLGKGCFCRRVHQAVHANQRWRLCTIPGRPEHQLSKLWPDHLDIYCQLPADKGIV
jgi:endo-1,4-beta-xylanase